MNELVEFMRALTSDDVLRQSQSSKPENRSAVTVGAPEGRWESAPAALIRSPGLFGIETTPTVRQSLAKRSRFPVLSRPIPLHQAPSAVIFGRQTNESNDQIQRDMPLGSSEPGRSDAASGSR